MLLRDRINKFLSLSIVKLGNLIVSNDLALLDKLSLFGACLIASSALEILARLSAYVGFVLGISSPPFFPNFRLIPDNNIIA